MKLSEILEWKGKNPVIKDHGANNQVKDKAYCRGHNTALDSCDREIDREALTKQISEDIYIFSSKDIAARIISTMPTWLKPTERK